MRLFLPLALMLAMPAAAQVSRVNTTVACSGTITTGAASQTIIPQSAGGQRLWVFIQNPINATETLYVAPGGTAGVNNGSMELAPGGVAAWLAEAVPNVAISATAATTGHRFNCWRGE